MALTNAQKQQWLVAQGKPKSYMYFMTGPNLGPDWDWEKAVSGSYSQTELSGYLSSGEEAYEAHKAKSKKKKATDPGGPSAPGANCAKTAAKNVATWVDTAKTVATAWWSKMGKGFYSGGLSAPPADTVASFSKKIKQAVKEAVEELGEGAPEVVALQAFERLMDEVDIAIRRGSEAVFKVQAGWQSGNTNQALEGLTELRQLAKKLGDVEDLKPAAALFDDVWGNPEGVIEGLKDQVTALTIQQRQIASGHTWKSIALEGSDAWESLAIDWSDFATIDFDIVIRQIVDELANPSIAGVVDAEALIESMEKLTTIADLWVKKLVPEGDEAYEILHEAFELGTTFTPQLRDSLGDAVNAYTDLIDQHYKDLDWWQLGPKGTLEGSPIEKWAAKPDDMIAAIQDEAERVQAVLEKSGQVGIWPSSQAGEQIGESLFTAASQEAVPTLMAVHDQVKYKLPGQVKTAEQVIEELDQGYVASIKGATTDELNPLVQEKLEDADELATLTYFMTKKQKVDFVLLPKETFDQVEYVVKYKGQTLTGQGLTTAKTKYGIKNGDLKIIEKAPDAKPTAAAADPVTGATHSISVPEGAPKWWGDPMTDKQADYLMTLVFDVDGGQEAWLSGGVETLFQQKKITKGQASGLIEVFKGAQEGGSSVTVDAVQDALQYGTKKKITTGADAVEAAVEAIAEPDASDLAAASQAIDAGAAPKVSSAAPPNASWDEPHTFEYVGDGSKWGGAHRKWHFRDETGADWMLKHGADFRAEGELAAHRIGHAAGFEIAEARVVTQSVPGMGRQTGFMQKMYSSGEVRGELADVMPGGSFVGVDDDIVR